MANPFEDPNDPFADLEHRMKNPRPIHDVANANPGMNIFTKNAGSKTVRLKAENFELFNHNELLTDENGQLGAGLNKLQNKHDKLMHLARNRLGEVRTKYQKLEQDNEALRAELERYKNSGADSTKILDEYQQREARFKGSEQELRAMIEELKRANAELKTKYSPDEVQSLKEQYYITKQELDQAKREIYSMKDEIHKAGFERDSHIREVAHLNEKLTDLTSSKNKAERKTESLTEQVDKLQTNLKRSEGNCQLLHERLATIKKERDTLETESRSKIGTLTQNLKELQIQSANLLEQFRSQSKQCEHLDRENKQLLEYVNGYRKENDILAKQLVTVNTKQKQLVLEIESFKSIDASAKNAEAMKMQNALLSLTDQLTQLRKLHANTLAENRQTKELLIEKESVLTSLGYERHKLQDKVVRNEHTLRQMERRLAGKDAASRQSPITVGDQTTTTITNSFPNVLTS